MRILVLAFVGLAAACGPAPAVSFDGEVALGLVETQVGFGPRVPGSSGHRQAQEWIVTELAAKGWETESVPFLYRGQTLTNISAWRQGSQRGRIILGAHYDTRRIADREPAGATLPVPGANDGASGVAVLLELARALGDRPGSCDLELVFFDGEDNGGLDGWEWAAGSRAYAAGLAEAPQAVVVVDMVGDRDLRLPYEQTSSPDLAAEIWEAARRSGSTAFVAEPGRSILDDHTPFLERGWRAVDIIDIEYPYWHTSQDTPDKVSAESLQQVGSALLTWLVDTCSATEP